MRIMTVDMENFGAEIVKGFVSPFLNRPAQDLASHLHAMEMAGAHPATEALTWEAAMAARESIAKVFEPYEEHLEDVCRMPMERLFKRQSHDREEDTQEYARLTQMPALLLILHDFGLHPTLLNTAYLYKVITHCQMACLDGQPASKTERLKTVLKATLHQCALLVFRHDPLQLGLSRTVDRGAPDEHLLQVLMQFVDFSSEECKATFAQQFISLQDARSLLQRKNASEKHATSTKASSPVRAFLWLRISGTAPRCICRSESLSTAGARRSKYRSILSRLCSPSTSRRVPAPGAVRVLRRPGRAARPGTPPPPPSLPY
jgi:hypothetical protein